MNYSWRTDNHVNLLINGEEFFPEVISAIRSARQEVLVETFIIFDDEVGRDLQRALIYAARRGVRVTLTADGYGTPDLSDDYISELTDAGVTLNLFDPQPRLFGARTNLFRRLHRKIVVIDSVQAFVGGINFGIDHLIQSGPMGKQDYAVEVVGPIVEDIRHACLTLLKDYGDGYRPLVPPCPLPLGRTRVRLAIRDNREHANDIELFYLKAIRASRSRLIIANAYFYPGYRLLRELRKAAQRNVEVNLILQGLPDMPLVRLCSKLLYDMLLRDGVHIYEYCDRPLHGKVALMDDRWATVGSSNLDPLSLSLNLEGNLLIDDKKFNHQLYRHLQQLARESCDEVPLKKTTPGFWWRAPIVFFSFHIVRYLLALLSLFPRKQKLIRPTRQQRDPSSSRKPLPHSELDHG